MSEYEPGQDPFSIGGSTEGTDKESAHKGGGGIVAKAGFYHVQVESVGFEGADKGNPQVLVVMVALAGEHESEINKKIYHRIYCSPLDEESKEQKRIAGIATFMFEMGVMSEQEAFGNPNFRVTKSHFERLEGCQAVVKVVHRPAEEYTDKKDGQKKMGKESWNVWNNDVWNPYHEKVKDVPKDHAILAYRPAPDQATQDASDLSDI